MKKRLIAFDLDSTLIDCEGIDQLARIKGVYDEVAKITEEAMQGHLDFTQSLIKRVNLLKGLDLFRVETFLFPLPYTNGLDPCFTFLRENNFSILLVSGGFEIFANVVKNEKEIDFAHSNRLEIIDGKLTGKLLGEIVDKEKKAFYLDFYAKKLGIDLKDCVAVGDGANDLAMINLAGTGIAFCAKEKVKKAAKFSVDKRDLMEIIKYL
jgi:phosphoserine phosphatase